MWPNPQETADLVTFTEKIFNGKLRFLCSVEYWLHPQVHLILTHIPIIWIDGIALYATLREKCPDTEFLLVRIFPHSDRVRRDTKYLSLFSPDAGKYGPEKAPYLDTFHTVLVLSKESTKFWNSKVYHILKENC